MSSNDQLIIPVQPDINEDELITPIPDNPPVFPQEPDNDNDDSTIEPIIPDFPPISPKIEIPLNPSFDDSEVINEFSGDYECFKLEYPFTYNLYSFEFPTLAHFYYGFKCKYEYHITKLTSVSDPINYISQLEPNLLRDDWFNIRFSLLSHGIYIKFCNHKFQQILLSTENKHLIYGFYNPTLSEDLLYLGQSLNTNEGYNALGITLMHYRMYFRTLRAHQTINISSESINTVQTNYDYIPTGEE